MKEEEIYANPITRGIFKDVSPATRRLWRYGAPGDGAPNYDDDFRRYYEAATGRDTGFIGRNTRRGHAKPAVTGSLRAKPKHLRNPVVMATATSPAFGAATVRRIRP